MIIFIDHWKTFSRTLNKLPITLTLYFSSFPIFIEVFHMFSNLLTFSSHFLTWISTSIFLFYSIIKHRTFLIFQYFYSNFLSFDIGLIFVVFIVYFSTTDVCPFYIFRFSHLLFLNYSWSNVFVLFWYFYLTSTIFSAVCFLLSFIVQFFFLFFHQNISSCCLVLFLNFCSLSRSYFLLF